MMLSRTFRTMCCVSKGGVLSPVLYAIYISSIIGQLQTHKLGCYIRDLYLASVMYADDLVLISSSLTVLQQEGQHPLTGKRAANFRRDLEAT